MNNIRISIIFLIMLLGLLLIPMLYNEIWYGYSFGWLWGFTASYHTFRPIWEVFQTGFPPGNPLFYIALVAVIGMVVDAVLIIIAIKASSHKRFVLLIALLNIGFGAATILVATIYSLLAEGIFVSPAAIFVTIWAGIAVYQIQKA